MSMSEFLRLSEDLTTLEWATRLKRTPAQIRDICEQYWVSTRDYQPQERKGESNG